MEKKEANEITVIMLSISIESFSQFRSRGRVRKMGNKYFLKGELNVSFATTRRAVRSDILSATTLNGQTVVMDK